TATATPHGAPSRRSVGSSAAAPSGRRTSRGSPREPLQEFRLYRSRGRMNVTTEGQRAGGTAMRSKLRNVALVGGIGAILVLVLLALAAGLGSWAPAIVGGILGVLLIIVGCSVMLKALDHVMKAMDRATTRVRNLEVRADTLSRRAEVVDALREQVDLVQTVQERGRNTLAAARKDLRTLRTRVPAGFHNPDESSIKEVRATARSAMRTSFESGIQLGGEPATLLSP